MEVFHPHITNTEMETTEAADVPKVPLGVAQPVSVPLCSPLPLHPSHHRERGEGVRHQMRGGWVTGALVSDRVAGAGEISGGTTQRPQNGCHTGVTGEIWATKSHWAPGFLRTFSWMLHLGKKLCQG